MNILHHHHLTTNLYQHLKSYLSLNEQSCQEEKEAQIIQADGNERKDLSYYMDETVD